MAANTLEYLLTLRDNFSSQMNRAAQTAIVSAGGIQSAGSKIIGSLSGLTDALGGGFEAMMGDYSKLGNLLSAIPGPIGEIGRVVGTAFGQMIEDVEKQSEAFRKLSASTGASVEFLSAFTQAADDERISAESVNTALERFSKTLGGIDDITEGVAIGGEKVGKVLDGLGVATANADGSLRKMEEVLPEVSDIFAEMPDGAQKSALAVQLFGKRGTEMIPILNKGSAGLKEMMQAAKDAGLVIGQETVNAVNALKRAQDALGDSIQGVTTKIGSGAIPVFADFMTQLNGWLSGTYVPFVGYVDESGKVIAQTSEELWRMEDAIAGISTTINGQLLPTADVMDRVSKATDANTTSFQEYSEESQRVVEWNQKMADSAKYSEEKSRDLARAQEDLAQKNRDLANSFRENIEPMDDMQKAQKAYEIATGLATVEQLKQEQAAKAIIQQFKDGTITAAEMTKRMYDLGTGTLTADEALGIANTSAYDFRSEMNNVIGMAYAANPALLTAAAGTDSFKGSLDRAADSASTARTRAGEYADTVRQVPDRNVVLTVDGRIDQSYYSATSTYSAPQDRRVTITYYGQYQGYDPGYACFAGDVLVSTPAGPREIKSMQPGDAVLTYDHALETPVASTVAKVFEHRRRPLYWLRLANGASMVTTREHPFWLPLKGWYENAAALNAGDVVMLQDGAHVEVSSAVAAGWGLVWNIEVDNYHTYYANHVLVHNKCFAAGTLIDTPAGERLIEQIKPGDLVMAYDHAEQAVVERPVVKAFSTPDQDICQVQLSTHRYVRCTPAHPLYVPHLRMYINAGNVQVGDRLKGRMADSPPVVEHVEWPATVAAAQRTVYNIEVEGAHNYFAGGVLVHNASEILTPGDMGRMAHSANLAGAGTLARANATVRVAAAPVVNTPITIAAAHDPVLLARRIAESQKQAAQAAALRASVGI